MPTCAGRDAPHPLEARSAVRPAVAIEVARATSRLLGRSALESVYASGSPVSSSVFSPLSTIIQPGPATLAAVFGAPSS
jgi:hypothetical protein